MALTITSGLTLQDACETISTWTRTHSVAQASSITDTDDFLQGSASVAWQTKSTGVDQGMCWDKTTANIDLSSTYLRMRVQAKEANKYETRANGGVRVFVSDGAFGADNWGEWFIEGSDTIPFKQKWMNVVIDTTTPFDRTSATAPTMTTIRRIGISTNMITKPAKVQNINVDIIRTGRGLTITGTNAIEGQGWQEIVDDDVSNTYGVVERLPDENINIAGEIIFGDAAGTGSVEFTDDQNEILVFQKPSVGNLDGLYNILIQGNSTGFTDIRFGKLIGTGDDRQGVLGGIFKALGDRVVFDSETDAADINSCYIYGATFDGFGNIKLAGSTAQRAIGCQFIGCDEWQPNNADVLNNTVIAPSPDRGVEFTTASIAKQTNFIAGATVDQPVGKVWQVDVSATPDAFVDYTTEANEATANDVICFPATEAAGDYFAIGFKGKFAKVRINTGTARSGGTLVLEYKTSGGWSTLTATDGTNTLSTTGLQNITFTPPTDWVVASIAVDSGINAEIPVFYIRFRVTATMTTNPLVTQIFIGDLVEHHVHYPDATKVGGYTAEAFKFFGFIPVGAPKWHGENSATRVTINAGSFVVNQTYKILTVGSTDFTLIGSADNNVGTVFIATGIGSGTGTATEVLQINATEGANPAANEFDNTGATAGDVAVTNAVTLTVTVKDASGAVVQNARVAIFDANGVQLMNELTTAGGIATESYNYSGDIGATVKVRKTSAAPKYIPVAQSQTITASGLNLTITIFIDPNNAT